MSRPSCRLLQCAEQPWKWTINGTFSFTSAFHYGHNTPILPLVCTQTSQNRAIIKGPWDTMLLLESAADGGVGRVAAGVAGARTLSGSTPHAVLPGRGKNSLRSQPARGPSGAAPKSRGPSWSHGQSCD